MLSGSLPPGTPADWYADLVRALRDTGARVAVDTSEAPLRRCWPPVRTPRPTCSSPTPRSWPSSPASPRPTSLADPDGRRWPPSARCTSAAWARCCSPSARDGALLSTRRRRLWSATPPPIAVRSTVGAGDCSLAGYLLADLAGAPPAERLRTAVAYGAASAALPGSAVPTPAQVDGELPFGSPPARPARAPPAPPSPPVPAAGRDAR